MTTTEEMRERYLDAALTLINANEPVTLHRLGRAVGRSHTALYWHFRDIDDVIATLVDREFAGMVSGSVTGLSDTRDAILAMASAVRAAFHTNPKLASHFVRLPRPGSEMASVTVLMLRLLRDLGVDELRLATAYQALESVIIGVLYFDFEGAPDHVALRRERLYAVNDPVFAAVTVDAAAVEKHNAQAFRFAVEAVLDAAVMPISAHR